MHEVAKLSISVPDDLVDDMRGLATGNVSAFVTTAIRHEVDRRRLVAFIDELEDELGPADEEEVSAFAQLLTPAKAAGGGRRAVRNERRSAS